MREYSTKVDDLIKDKLEATEEKKSKEQDEKEVVANSVIFFSCIDFDSYIIRLHFFMIL